MNLEPMECPLKKFSNILLIETTKTNIQKRKTSIAHKSVEREAYIMKKKLVSDM